MEKEQKLSWEDFGQTVDLFSQIVERILGNENIHVTTKEILKTLRVLLKGFGGGLYLKDKEGRNLHLFDYTKTNFIERLAKFIPGNMFRFAFPIKNSKALISKCVAENKIVTSDRLADFFTPIVPKTPLDSIQFIGRIQYLIGIPIRIKGTAIGVLFAVFRKKGLTLYEKSILQFYANLSGLALENNLKLEEINERYEMEKETTSILSHELKTPIAIAHHSAQTILMTLEKYKDNVDKKSIAELLKTARDVQHGMDRLARICTSIFNLREVENKVPRDIHLIDLKKQCGQILYTHERRAHEKGLEFEFHLEENKRKYHGAIIQLEQIMTILLDNAVKYTDKGRITVESRFRNKKLICTVTDTGIGIPEHQRHLVFNRFYRNPKKGKINQIEGLGLGLYIAKKIIREIKGSIEIDQNPEGRGTRFTVKIPLYAKKTS